MKGYTAGMLKISISFGEEVIERSLDPIRSPYTVGRTDENDIVIPDPSISRHHGQFVAQPEGWEIVDFQSTNGTAVNGERIEHTIIQGGDRLLFGSIHATVSEMLEIPLHEETAIIDRDRNRPSGQAQINLIGISDSFETLRRTIARVAAKGSTLMLRGEMGSGRGMIARAIHLASPAAAGPFVAVNCGSVGDDFESQFCGCVAGEGNAQDSRGYFSSAHGGTLFLDEVGELSSAAQEQLLRYLNAQSYTPVGSDTREPSSLRLITSTSIDLNGAVVEGQFRRDLLHRLKVVEIQVPPLRERRADIALLANHFAGNLSIELGIGFGGLTAGARKALEAYSWPGNVRELCNSIKSALITADGKALVAAHLKLEGGSVSVAAPDRALGEVERDHIIAVLNDVGGNKAKAARILGISRTALYEKLDRFGLR